MKLERIRKINKSRMIIGGVIVLGIIGTITILPSFTECKVTQDISVANGTANYKASDLNMIAMYKSDDGENYTEIADRMPDSGYIINEEKSYCNLNGSEDTNAILKTVNGNHVIANLIKGDKCYLYFDKYTPPMTIPDIIAANNPKDDTPDFSKTATTDEGVYKVSDGMYGGESYYFRGAVDNNYVKFANFCWRIIRINGDGSIRLIYDGESCHANGTKTVESIAVTNTRYFVISTKSEFVGWTYTSGSQRPTDTNKMDSTIKISIENWYNTNITDKGYDAKVTIGKYCNDREVQSGYTWATKPTSTFYYAAYERLYTNKTPTLSCTNINDVYNQKAGLITADEVSFAGGVYRKANQSYYLYNGNYYWTMTPAFWWYNSSTYYGAQQIPVCDDGTLSGEVSGGTSVSNVSREYGARPVINLLSDTEFKAGTDGTLNNPYEVI